MDERDVSPDYFSTLKARLIQGRVFTADDDATHPQVTVINEALARKYFPGENPIGKMIGNGDLSEKSMRQVVGVIENMREGALDDEVWPVEYFSIYHGPDNVFTVAVRVSGPTFRLLKIWRLQAGISALSSVNNSPVTKRKRIF